MSLCQGQGLKTLLSAMDLDPARPDPDNNNDNYFHYFASKGETILRADIFAC